MLQVPPIKECQEMTIQELTELMLKLEKVQERLKTIIRKKHQKIGPL